jgi:A/G-specific adenine glycosylase
MSEPAARDLLLAWYDRQRRDLPWRRSREPWAVWLAEVVLQQTRVETAIPYYERLLARFPTPAALAAADEEELLALWSGLGYYQRARRLRAAAARVAAAGAMPTSARELAALPGVGPYTAAAIASIAFGEAVPVVDGNVVRVLSRRLARADAAASAAARRRLAAAAAELVDPARPGDSNQALMELGATLCTPRRPACERCPLATGCRGREAGDPETYPAPRRRPAPRRVRMTAVWVEDAAGRLLLARRAPDEAVLPGLWELPTVPARGPARGAASLAARYGGRWRLGARRLAVRHAITFRQLDIELRAAAWEPAGVGEAAALAWHAPAAAARLALTGATRKLLARALA